MLKILNFIIIIGVSFAAHAHLGQKEEWMKRSSSREEKRWTLQEWLAQKERNQLMDIWLAMNSPSPYELSLQAGYESYQKEQVPTSTPPTISYATYRSSISAYAQIFGLSLDYENNTEELFKDFSGSFNLRLLGNSIQNSHLNLSYGQRTRETTTPNLRILQQFWDVSLNLHINRHFGLLGQYRSFIPTTEASLGDISGSITKYGLFIDYGILRVYGKYSQEIFKSTTQTLRTGVESGIQLFF